MGCGLLCLCRPLGIFLLEAVLLLVPDQLVVALEDQQALLALIVETRCAGEPTGTFVVGVQTRLVLVDLSRLLSRVLEPDNNHSGAEGQQLGKVFQVIILWVGVVLKELLQHFDLVVREPGSVGPFGVRRHGEARMV